MEFIRRRLETRGYQTTARAVFYCVMIMSSGAPCLGRAQAQTPNFYTPVPPQGEFLQNLTYGYNTSDSLDVCRPNDGTTPHAGIIMIHGGRWSYGDKTGLMDSWCQGFAKLGFVAADIDYRLDDPQNPRPDWPAFQIGDVQLAIRWMRYHAGELDLDPTRLCAYGTSAGAYLAVFAGTQQSIFPSDEDWIAPAEPVNLSCLVDGFGPVDLTTPAYQPKILRELIGASYQMDPGIYKDDSPFFRVTAQAPATLLIHGTQDTTVPIGQSQSLLAEMRRDGVPAHLITYDGSHAYHGLSPAGLAQVFNQIAGFLKSRVGN